MQAAILDNGRMHVGDFPDPTPETGQVVVRTHRCALCASDAHFLKSGHTIVERSQANNGPYAGVDLSKPIVMGHEYVGEVIDYAPGSKRPLPTGTLVTSVPGVRLGNSFGIVGYYPQCPGGYGEYMLLDEDLLLEIPKGTNLDLAALIEPLAVGIEHARAGDMQSGEIPLVLGCGAIGLSVITGLKLAGVSPIVACDLNANRRDLALKAGADVVINPSIESPYLPHTDLGNRAPNVVFECVGTAGIMNMIINEIVPSGRIVMGGFCLEPEEIYVPTAQTKHLRVHFAGGEGPDDMRAARDAIIEGKVDLTPWLGGTIGLSEVESSLKRMLDPAEPIRRVVDPSKP